MLAAGCHQAGERVATKLTDRLPPSWRASCLANELGERIATMWRADYHQAGEQIATKLASCLPPSWQADCHHQIGDRIDTKLVSGLPRS
jgi:hypothetical protein